MTKTWADHPNVASCANCNRYFYDSLGGEGTIICDECFSPPQEEEGKIFEINKEHLITLLSTLCVLAERDHFPATYDEANIMVRGIKSANLFRIV